MTERTTRPKRLIPFDFIRGFLMGLVELVPGVSGGTVALVTGIYDELIGSASAALHALKRLIVGPERLRGFWHELAAVQWRLLIPVLVGMVTAVFSVAGVMSAFVTNTPEHARGLFFGLVIVSIAVPVMMARKAAGQHGGTYTWVGAIAAFALAAIASYVLVGFAGGGSISNPPVWVLMGAAAIAICALVIPGVSGSFFLLAVGLYTVTLDAVHTRDWGYIAVFGLGALLGLVSFVQLLQYLLKRFRVVTLMAMAGLMLGSLRALWPWQATTSGDPSAPGTLIAPYTPVAWPIVLMLAGAVIVLALILVENLVQGASRPTQAPQSATPTPAQ